MQEFEFTSEYAVQAESLFGLLRKPAFQEALALSFGALEVTAGDPEEKGGVLKMKIERLDPGWNVIGAGLKGKPRRAVIIHDWHLAEMHSEWSQYYLDQGKNVFIEGETRVEPKGEEACRMIESGSFEFRLPVVGRNTEKKLRARLDEVHPRRVDFIMQRLGLDV